MKGIESAQPLETDGDAQEETSRENDAPDAGSLLRDPFRVVAFLVVLIEQLVQPFAIFP
jgi:hypothetical protein